MNEKLIPLATFWYPSEAHVVKSFLQSHDILSFVFDESLLSFSGTFGALPPGVRLMVMKDEYEEAVMLLKENSEIDFSEAIKED